MTAGNWTTHLHEHEEARLSISSSAVWVSHQGAWPMTATLGLGAGVLSAYAMTSIGKLSPEPAASVPTLAFGFSAVSLLLLQSGQPGPVTHHMTLPAAVAATTVLSAGREAGIALRLGALAGMTGALVGELAARVFLIHGDTHFDPPTIAIVVMNTVILVIHTVT